MFVKDTRTFVVAMKHTFNERATFDRKAIKLELVEVQEKLEKRRIESNSVILQSPSWSEDDQAGVELPLNQPRFESPKLSARSEPSSSKIQGDSDLFFNVQAKSEELGDQFDVKPSRKRQKPEQKLQATNEEEKFEVNEPVNKYEWDVIGLKQHNGVVNVATANPAGSAAHDQEEEKQAAAAQQQLVQVAARFMHEIPEEDEKEEESQKSQESQDSARQEFVEELQEFVPIQAFEEIGEVIEQAAIGLEPQRADQQELSDDDEIDLNMFDIEEGATASRHFVQPQPTTQESKAIFKCAKLANGEATLFRN